MWLGAVGCRYVPLAAALPRARPENGSQVPGQLNRCSTSACRPCTRVIQPVVPTPRGRRRYARFGGACAAWCTTCTPPSSQTRRRCRQVGDVSSAATAQYPWWRACQCGRWHAVAADVSAAVCCLPARLPNCASCCHAVSPRVTLFPSLLSNPNAPADYWDYAKYRSWHRFFSSMSTIFATQVGG